MTLETEEKIKRDAEAHATKNYKSREGRAICRNNHAAGAKPWAEMCEELERALEKCSKDYFPKMTAKEALSKLREFRGGK